MQTSYEILDEIASMGIIVSLGLPVLYKNGLFNAAAIISNGEVLGFVAKQFLAGDGLHYEPRWFKGQLAHKLLFLILVEIYQWET